MKQNAQLSYVQMMQSLIVASLVVSVLFLLQGHDGFSLRDEGYLWYGAQRVLLGEIPILDFLAYDPGRYFWSATVMALLGDNGIIALRVAIACFQIAGLYMAIAMLRKYAPKSGVIFMSLAVVTLVIWMYPRHKIFDITISIALVGVLAGLIEVPSHKRYFYAGLIVGLAAVFGRNHGLYGGVACLFVIILLATKRQLCVDEFKKVFSCGLGVIVGYSPIILMCVMVPGFFDSFLDSIYFYLFEIEGTNLPLPVPWPWLVSFSEGPFQLNLRNFITGLYFVIIPIIGLVSVTWISIGRVRENVSSPLFIAASILTLPYMHHAYSRASIGHLSQAIFPFLIAMLVFLSTRSVSVKWPLLILFLATGLNVMLPKQSYLGCNGCVNVNVSGSVLSVNTGTAASVNLLKTLSDKLAPNGESFIVAPFWPGAYALLERKSPMWEIYALFSRSSEFQKAEISRIENASPVFAYISTRGLDGNNKLAFRFTHPLIYRYIKKNFMLDPALSGRGYQIFIRREEGE